MLDQQQITVHPVIVRFEVLIDRVSTAAGKSAQGGRRRRAITYAFLVAGYEQVGKASDSASDAAAGVARVTGIARRSDGRGIAATATPTTTGGEQGKSSHSCDWLQSVLSRSAR